MLAASDDPAAVAADTGSTLKENGGGSELAADFRYSREQFLTPLAPEELDRESILMQHAFGFEGAKRSNIHFLNDQVMVSAVGNMLQFTNLKTMTHEYLSGISGGGIGAISVDPTKKYIAVAEKGMRPNIYIYEFPSLLLFRVLRRGAERGFSDVAFDSGRGTDVFAGRLLASVGTDPDYMLTIWDWKEERIVLRSKAFSQDVFKVAFSPEHAGNLTSSGVGHIKFWKMSSTFTGLKLQGQIGKFGICDLSDICGFAELPDGKVLSGTEYGSLLLWDAGFIKCEIMIRDRQPCHQGPIEVVFLEDGEIFTAGDDGFVRVWDFETIDNADATAIGGGVSINNVFEAEPVDEIKIGAEVKIRCMVKIPGSIGQYVVQDASGHLWRLDVKKRATEKLVSFHAGAVAGLDSSPGGHRVASIGADGSIRLHDFISKNTLYKSKFGSLQSAGTCLLYAPESLDPAGATIISGYSDGVIRIVRCSTEAFILHQAIKPHSQPITHLAFNVDATLFASASLEKNVFIHLVAKEMKIIPLGFIQLPDIVAAITWSSTVRNKILIACKNGHVAEWEVPESEDQVDNTITYELTDLSFKQYKLKRVLRKKQKKKPGKKDSNSNQQPGQDANANANAAAAAAEAAVENDGSMQNSSDPGGADDSSLDGKTKMEGAAGDEAADANSAAPASAANAANGAQNGDEQKAEEGETEERDPAEPIKDSFEDISGVASEYGSGEVIIEDYNCEVDAAVYLDSGNFVLAVHNSLGGELWLCHMDKELPLACIQRHGAPFSILSISLSGSYFLSGTKDGTVFVRPFRRNLESSLEEEAGNHAGSVGAAADNGVDGAPSGGDALNATSYAQLEFDSHRWIGKLHDSDTGAITGVACSFDDSHLVTSGKDGNFFSFRITMEEIRTKENPDGDLSAQSANELIEDIVEPTVYSIQEAKQKAELDKQLEDAEVKKQNARHYIMELRQEFLNINNENKSLPDETRVDERTFNVDPGLRENIEVKTQEKINLVRKELEWISEKEAVGLRKLRQKFLDNIETERIVIKGFKANSNEGESGKNAQQESTDEDSNKNKKNVKTLDIKSKMEVKKKLRAERANIWKQLMDNKPDENYEDPNDVAAIRFAENHMGDYKLKTGANFIVPENERVDAEKKRRQITLLKESIYTIRKNFNSYVLQMRDEKERIVNQIQKYNIITEKIDEDLHSLGVDEETEKWQPVVELEAYPERRDRVTDEELEVYKREVQEAEARAKADAQGGGGGFGGEFSGGNFKKAAAGSETSGNNAVTSNASKSSVAKNESGDDSTTSEQGSSSMEATSNTDLSLTENIRTNLEAPYIPGDSLSNLANLDLMHVQEAKSIRARWTHLKYRKATIQKLIDDSVMSFDRSLEELRDERMLLEQDLKFADMKLLLLYQEWVLLKEFEKHDKALAEKLNSKKKEKTEIMEKIAECQEKLSARKVEVEKVMAQEKAIQEEFQSALGENNKFEEVLTKIFKKKIKRVKKKVKVDKSESTEDGEVPQANSEEADEDADSDEEDSDEDDDSDVSADSDDEGEETCPQDCDPALYTKICDLRERRLDQEDILAEIQKAIDVLKKENDALIKKEKVIDNNFKQTSLEIQDFQTQKQQKLNELDVVIPLRFHQILWLENYLLPDSLSSTLVFTNEGVKTLKKRIKELKQEKTDIRKQHKELKKMHVNLNKSKKEKQNKLAELEARAYDVQMLKFGQIIDLEKLERMSINKGADELREKLLKEEAKQQRELEFWESKINKSERMLTDVTKENTERLDLLAALTESQIKLERALNSTQSMATAEYSGPQKRDVVEQQQLLTLVQAQAQEIMALRNEIACLARKTGPIYKPHGLNVPSTASGKHD